MSETCKESWLSFLSLQKEGAVSKIMLFLDDKMFPNSRRKKEDSDSVSTSNNLAFPRSPSK